MTPTERGIRELLAIRLHHEDLTSTGERQKHPEPWSAMDREDREMYRDIAWELMQGEGRYEP